MALMHGSLSPASLAKRTYGKLVRTGRAWEMTGVPVHVALRLKANFPRLPKEKPEPFVFGDSNETRADLHWFLQRYPMQMSDAARAELRRGKMDFEMQRDAIERVLLPGWTPGAPAIALKDGKAFYDYQARAIEVAQRLGRLVLVDPASAGKTLTTIGSVMKREYLPAAIVVEPHLLTQWRDNGVKKFTNLVPHIIRSHTPYRLPRADIYLFGYSRIAGWVDVAAKGYFRSFGADECQQFRTGYGPRPEDNPIKKYVAAKEFARHAALRIGVTASLIYNYGSEAYPIIDLFAPGTLGSEHDFRREWCSGKLVTDPDALGTYLREQHVVISRTEEDIGRALPKPNVIPVEVPYDHDVEAEHLDLARSLSLRVLEGSFSIAGQAAMELDKLLRRVTGIAKARHVAAYVEMLVKAGEPVLLAGWHRDVYDIWLERLKHLDPVMYTGSETGSRKDRSKEDFISGRSKLMIISLRSGAGLDGLEQVCNTLVIGEMDWSPGVHNQLIWRLRRAAQPRWPVNVVFCHANGGADPVLMSTLGIKAGQAQGIERPGAAIEQVVSDTSRIKELARAFLERNGG
jgi:hypothetical protein